MLNRVYSIATGGRQPQLSKIIGRYHSNEVAGSLKELTISSPLSHEGGIYWFLRNKLFHLFSLSRAYIYKENHLVLADITTHGHLSHIVNSSISYGLSIHSYN